MDSKSHTIQEIAKAIIENKKIFELDTNGHGEDDLLIADTNEPESDVLADVLYHLGCDSEYASGEKNQPTELPGGWSLRQITVEEIFAENWPEIVSVIWKNSDIDEPFCFKADNPDEQNMCKFGIEGNWLESCNEEYIIPGYVIVDSAGYAYWSPDDSASIAQALNSTPFLDCLDFCDYLRPPGVVISE